MTKETIKNYIEEIFTAIEDVYYHLDKMREGEDRYDRIASRLTEVEKSLTFVEEEMEEAY